MATDNSKLVYGGDLMLFVGSTKTPLAFSKDAKLTISMKEREISSKDSGMDSEFLGGKREWSASTDCLLAFSLSGSTTSMDAVYTLFLAGLPIDLAFGSKTGTSPAWSLDIIAGKKSFSGKALITGLDITASENDTASYSISLKGTGPLTLA